MSAYWEQLDYKDLMSMQGVELDDSFESDDVDLSQDEDDTDLEQDNECCGHCMMCLGMSWNDFR